MAFGRHLLFHSFPHTLQDPDDPASLRDLRDQSEAPLAVIDWRSLLRTDAKEDFEKPFGDIQQSKVILFRYLGSLGLDVFKQTGEER